MALVKLKRHPAAGEAFQSAVRSSARASFPAWKGLIWTSFTAKHYGDGLQHLESLADQLVTKKIGATDDERDQVAVWLGQAMSGLEKCYSNPKIQSQIAESHDRLTELLPEHLLESYQAGREFSDLLYQQLTADANLATQTAKAKEAADKEQNLEKIAGRTEATAKQREQLRRTAEDLEIQGQRRLQQIDRQLTVLERNYMLLQGTAQSAIQSVQIAQGQIQWVQTQALNQARDSRNRDKLQEIERRRDDQIQQLNGRIAVAEMQWQFCFLQGAAMSQMALDVLQLRQQTAAQLQEKATGLVSKDAELKQWQDRLAKQGNLVGKAPIKGKSLTAHQKKEKAKSLKTYIEFDPDWERITILDHPPAE